MISLLISNKPEGLLSKQAKFSLACCDLSLSLVLQLYNFVVPTSGLVTAISQLEIERLVAPLCAKVR
jgi:hypothetical protein